MHSENGSIFLLGPLLLSNIGIKMIMPSFAALLANAAWQRCSYGTPVLGAVLFDHLAEYVVFLLGPWPLGNE
jgi:hypothetical protein